MNLDKTTTSGRPTILAMCNNMVREMENIIEAGSAKGTSGSEKLVNVLSLATMCKDRMLRLVNDEIDGRPVFLVPSRDIENSPAEVERLISRLKEAIPEIADLKSIADDKMDYEVIPERMKWSSRALESIVKEALEALGVDTQGMFPVKMSYEPDEGGDE